MKVKHLLLNSSKLTKLIDIKQYLFISVLYSVYHIVLFFLSKSVHIQDHQMLLLPIYSTLLDQFACVFIHATDLCILCQNFYYQNQQTFTFVIQLQKPYQCYSKTYSTYKRIRFYAGYFLPVAHLMPLHNLIGQQSVMCNIIG